MRKNIKNLFLDYLSKKLLPLLLLFLFSCVYYNTFYNAEVNYKKAEKIIEQTPPANSEDDKIPAQAKKLLGKAIENSTIVIDSYPESKYVDDAYFIIGKASFLRKEYFNAEKYLKGLIDLYSDSEYYNEAQIWLIYTYLKMDNVEDWCTYLHYSDALAVIEVSKSTTGVEKTEIPILSSSLMFVFQRCQLW